MDWALIAAMTLFFLMVATALCVNYLISRKGKRENREVGYKREEFEINPANVPEFKPTWRNVRDKREAS